MEWKKVLPQQGTERLLHMEEIVEEKYQKFLTDRIEGENFILGTMNKEKN